VSSALATILLVAVVVILAATLSVFALDFLSGLDEPAPAIAESSGEFLPQDGFEGGVVQLTHLAGDSVPVSDIEISVRAGCDSGTRQGRMVNLPAGAGNDISAADGQIEGDNIFDERSLNSIDNAVDGISNGGALLHNDEYTAGETTIFRIPASKCTLTAGSEISVRVVHAPSQAVIINQDLTV